MNETIALVPIALIGLVILWACVWPSDDEDDEGPDWGDALLWG